MENLTGPDEAEEAQTELLRRIATGDIQAMATFYDQTATPLFSVAVRILCDPSEAEEVIQVRLDPGVEWNHGVHRQTPRADGA